MNYKLNHVLFSRKGGAAFLSWKIAAAAVAIVLLAVVAVNWDYLTKSSIDRFRDAYAARNFDEALAIAQAILAEDPSSVEALQAIASAHIQKAILRQDFEFSIQAAFAAANAALDLDRDNVESRRLLGVAYEISGDNRRALEEYEKAFKIDPQNATIMAHLAAAHEKLGKVTLAEDFFQRAVLASPDNYEARVLYSRFLLRDGRPDKAAELVRVAIDSDVPLVAAEANRILSAALLKQGDIGLARAPAEKALALAPDSAQVVENYGSLLMAELFGNFPKPFTQTLAEVRELADQAAALDPSLAAASFLAFKAAYSQNDKEAADAYGKKTIELLLTDQTLSEKEKGEIRVFIRTVPLIKATAR